MERGHHLCKKHPKFADNFKVMFNHGDLQLFNNKELQFTINSDIASQESLQRFCEEIGSLDLKQRYPDTEELIQKYSMRKKREDIKVEHPIIGEELKEEPPRVVNNIIAILKQESEEEKKLEDEEAQEDNLQDQFFKKNLSVMMPTMENEEQDSKQELSALHQSAMDILAAGINKDALEQRHKDTINKKYIFS